MLVCALPKRGGEPAELFELLSKNIIFEIWEGYGAAVRRMDWRGQEAGDLVGAWYMFG